MQLLRARLLSQTGQVPAATTALQNLLSDAPENREARLLLASLYTLQENWRSLDALIEPIASDPQLADIALYLSGRAALGQNRVGRARAQFEAALEQQATAGNRLAPSLHFYRGVCLAQLQREPEARRELAQAIEAGFVPETPEEAVRAAQTLLQVGLAEPTVPLLEALTLRGLRPTAEVWALLGRAQQACGQLERAISAYTEALQLKPQQVELLALRGEGLRQIGLLDAAVVDYTTALQIAPSQHALHYPLALSYLQQGQLTDAAAQMTLAAERQPERSDLALWQALLYYTLNDSEAAHSALQRYFKNCGTTPRDSAHYLNYSLQVGSRPSRALEQLQPHAANSLPLGYFYAYCLRDLSRKAILDFAGRAETPATARAQLCATLFWMAQHEYQTGQIAQAWELLDLALETQAVDQPEYQLARWQRAHGS
jgi:tetratricopeptide (TPR) repeat protein